MKLSRYAYIFSLLALFLLAPQAFSNTTPWSQWVAKLKQEAVSEDISPTLFDSVFEHMSAPQQAVLGLAHSQPEHRLTYPQYLHTRVDQSRIALGKKEFQQNHNLLMSIQNKYGVDAGIIVALWGMETSYGRFMGTFSTIQALATLAYQSNRPDFFRKELLLALHIVNDKQITADKFKGEWAGATGQCQFMPSSWYQYAVDYDGDGRKDIWTSVPDVLASIANYMRGHGWEPGEPVSITVKLPAGFDRSYIQTREVKSISQWAAMGITQPNGAPLQHSSQGAFLINPDGGPVWLALNNFRVILSYNNSIYYAGAIEYMAEQITH